jgi:hypothetical protein
MSFWNHRVMRHKKEGKTWLAIHEVYYNDEGEPHSWTEEPVSLAGECIEDLREELKQILRCLDKPTLEYKNE